MNFIQNIALTCLLLVYLSPSIAGASTAEAKQAKKKPTTVQNSRCAPTSTLTVQLSESADSFKELSVFTDTLVNKITTEAEQAELSDLFLSSSNFTIAPNARSYSTTQGGKYRLNGRISFSSKTPKKTIKLAEILSEQDYAITYNERQNGGAHCR